MPSSTSSSRDPRTLSFVLACAIFAVVELTLTWLLPNPARKELQDYRQRVAAAPAAIQFMGDSAVGAGVSCEQLNRLVSTPDAPFVMMAAYGSGPVFAYFALKQELAAGTVPKAIIYAPSPHTFASSRLPKFVACYASPGEILEVACHTWEFSEITYGLLCRASYSLRYREELGEFIRSRDRSALVRLRGSRGRGAEAQPDPAADALQPGTKTFTARDFSPKTYGKPFAVLPMNDWAIRGLLRLAAERRVPVVWAMMPVPKAVEESRLPFDFAARYCAYIAGVETATPGLEYANSMQEPPLYADCCFRDPTHLNGYGRAKFTAALAETLPPALARLKAIPPPSALAAQN